MFIQVHPVEDHYRGYMNVTCYKPFELLDVCWGQNDLTPNKGRKIGLYLGWCLLNMGST